MSNLKFVDTDPEQIINEMIASFEAYAGRTLNPADPIRLLINWSANIIVQERAMIDNAAKMNLLNYATGDYLKELAEMFKDCTMLEATPAKCIMQFKLSKATTETYTIDLGIRVAVNDLFFETIEPLVFLPETDTATVTVQCMTSGEIGNGYVAGQITTLVDVFNYYDSCTNITDTADGADAETEEAFRERMRLSNDAYSVAGPTGAYVYHVKSVSTEIEDVLVNSDSPGVVDILVLCTNGTLPSDTLIDDIKSKLNDEKIRPLTDTVNIAAPQVINYDIDITYYISNDNVLIANEISTAVESAINEFVVWQKSKIGRDINESKLISMLIEAGAKRVVVRSPNYTKISNDAIAVVENINIINGGVEND